jgi:hypothetical protein
VNNIEKGNFEAQNDDIGKTMKISTSARTILKKQTKANNNQYANSP